MPQQGPEWQKPEYEETVDPHNPPASVLRPSVRRSVVRTYVGGIVAVFAIVGVALIYWAATDSGGDEEIETLEPSAVGTAGDLRRDDSPGGDDPAPDSGTTRDEITDRGGAGGAQPLPGIATTAPVTKLAALFEESPQAVAGRRIDLQDVDVETTQGRNFWIRDGDARVAVVAPQGSPEVRAGHRVTVSGNVEPDGNGSVRLRATRVTVKE